MKKGSRDTKTVNRSLTISPLKISCQNRDLIKQTSDRREEDTELPPFTQHWRFDNLELTRHTIIVQHA